MSFSKAHLKEMERIVGEKKAKKIQAEVREQINREKIIRRFEISNPTSKEKKLYH